MHRTQVSCIAGGFFTSWATREAPSGDPGMIPEPGKSAGEGMGYPLQYFWASLVAQLVKNPLAVWETWVRSLGWKDPLEKGKATHSSFLAWRIPWSPWGLKEWPRLNDFHFHTYLYIHFFLRFFSLPRPTHPWGILFLYITSLEKESQDFPPLCFCLASSGSMIPAEIVSSVKPNWWNGSRLFCHFSRSLNCTSNLGLLTPHLFSLPMRFTTIIPAHDHRWFQIHQRNHAWASQLETWWWFWNTA